MVATTKIDNKELKINPVKILRETQDSNTSMVITIRGEEVATIVPRRRNVDALEKESLDGSNRKYSTEELAEYWKRFVEVSREISSKLARGSICLDVINDVRRKL